MAIVMACHITTADTKVPRAGTGSQWGSRRLECNWWADPRVNHIQPVSVTAIAEALSTARYVSVSVSAALLV